VRKCMFFCVMLYISSRDVSSVDQGVLIYPTKNSCIAYVEAIATVNDHRQPSDLAYKGV
jgi:hypothetical protein